MSSQILGIKCTWDCLALWDGTIPSARDHLGSASKPVSPFEQKCRKILYNLSLSSKGRNAWQQNSTKTRLALSMHGQAAELFGFYLTQSTATMVATGIIAAATPET